MKTGELRAPFLRLPQRAACVPQRPWARVSPEAEGLLGGLRLGGGGHVPGGCATAPTWQGRSPPHGPFLVLKPVAFVTMRWGPGEWVPTCSQPCRPGGVSFNTLPR